MPVRNRSRVRGFATAKSSELKMDQEARRFWRRRSRLGALALFFFLVNPATVFAQATAARSAQAASADQATDVQELRKEVNELRESVRRLEALLADRPIT